MNETKQANLQYSKFKIYIIMINMILSVLYKRISKHMAVEEI